MNITFGIDVLLASPDRMATLAGARVALVAHPASMTRQGHHSIDALLAAGANVVRAFGPQHGMRGDKQDNMVESEDFMDPARGIPVISLYGEHRRPTEAMLHDIDIVLFDLQDVGCRIYTYITTLKYFVEALADTGKALWVLDRPNPAGRPIDGLRLLAGHESFVGCDVLPTRHGLTVGELARWLAHRNGLDTDISVIDMQGYDIDAAPGYGWPLSRRPWVNPSPNASSLNMARCFPGTVLLEGTELSEGRGTTTPLEVIGAPGMPARAMLEHLRAGAPDWLRGVCIRPCFFEPTFHKHVGTMCEGLQFHTDLDDYDHRQFQPYRLVAGLLKSLRQLAPDYDLWRHHHYEYEPNRIPIDVIAGGEHLRSWVDDPAATFEMLDRLLQVDIEAWTHERQAFLHYK